MKFVASRKKHEPPRHEQPRGALVIHGLEKRFGGITAGHALHDGYRLRAERFLLTDLLHRSATAPLVATLARERGTNQPHDLAGPPVIFRSRLHDDPCVFGVGQTSGNIYFYVLLCSRRPFVSYSSARCTRRRQCHYRAGLPRESWASPHGRVQRSARRQPSG